jgi:hypothetical protein
MPKQTEHAVDEVRRVVGREVPDQVHGLADRDRVGHLVDVQDLEDADAQRVAVDGRHPLQRPALGVRRDQLVDPRLVLGDAADQPDGVLVHRRVGGDHALVEGLAQRQAADLALEEHVEGPLAGLGAGGHQSAPITRRRDPGRRSRGCRP